MSHLLPTHGRLTIADLAKAASVHPSTVSRALAGRPGIPPKTRQRIEDLAKQLGYKKDPFIAALMQSRRTGRPIAFKANLGMLMCDPKKESGRPSAWIHDVFEGAKEAAAHLGYQLEAFFLPDMKSSAVVFEEMLKSRNIGGLILPAEHANALPFQLNWDNYSVVSLHYGKARLTPHFHQVVSHHFHALIDTCQACYRQGYSKLGLILLDHEDNHYEYGRVVYGAFIAGTSDHHAETGATRILRTHKLEAAELRAWILKEQPDCVIMAGGGYSSTMEPIDLINQLTHLGIRIGSDIGLIMMGEKSRPEIAVYDERKKHIGRVAAKYLTDLVQSSEKGVPDEPVVYHVHGELLPGASFPYRALSEPIRTRLNSEAIFT